jgi:hypothetical protein
MEIDEGMEIEGDIEIGEDIISFPKLDMLISFAWV